MTNNYLTVKGNQIKFEWINSEFRNEDRPVIIFLHEGLGSIRQWRRFPQEICNRLQLPGIVYDRYGYGQSDSRNHPWPINFLETEAKEVLPDIIQKLKIDKHIIFGHSDGGTLGLWYASMNQENHLGSIIEAPHVIVEEISAQGIRDVVKASQNPKFVKSLSRYHGDRTADLIRSWSSVWLSDEGAKWEMKNRLSMIHTPVLFFQGEHDNFGSQIQFQEIENRTQGPFEGFIIPECGHVPHLEVMDFVLKKSEPFINDLIGK